MEKAMATHSSTLAWKIPWMEEPGRLQSMARPRSGGAAKRSYPTSEVGGVAERRYPTSKVRAGG